MATRKIEVQILGDDRQLTRTFGHAGKQARGFERDIGKASRGALAGSGAFRSMGRSLAFASGAFVGVASITAALRASVDAAEEFAKASKGVGAQLKANGESATAAAGQISKADAAMAKFGITGAESEAALSRLDRATGNIGKAIKLEGLTANVAAASHISLAQAAKLVGKVVQGTTTAFNRSGFVIKKGTSVTDALRIATAKFAGQAAAATTPLERLHAGVTNLEVAVGEALLPTINRIANSLNRWLSNSENVARVQRDIRSAVKVMTTALAAAKTVLQPLVEAFKLLAKISGGAENAVKGLATAFVLVKLQAKLAALSTVSTEVAGIGTAATVATGEVAGLRGALLGLGRLGPLVIPIALSFVPQAKDRGRKASQPGAATFFEKLPILGGLFSQVNELNFKIDRALGLLPKPGGTPGLRGPVGTPLDGTPPGLTGPVGRRRRPTSLQGRLNLDELRLADAQRTQNVKLQRAILVDEERLTLKLRDQAKTLKDRTKFAQQAAQIEDQIRAIDQQAASDAKARRDAAKAARQRAAAIAKAAAQLRASFSIPLRAQLAEAKAAATKGTKDDLAAARAIKKLAEKALASGRLGLQGQIDAWNTIASANQQIADLVKKHAKDVTTAFHKANLNKLLSGLGLTPEQARAARARLSQVGAGGTVPGSGTGAFGFAVAGGGTTVVHTQVNLDGRKVATSTTRHQQRRDRRNPQQKRGPHAK